MTNLDEAVEVLALLRVHGHQVVKRLGVLERKLAPELAHLQGLGFRPRGLGLRV